ncbi:polyprotein [Alfalfa virus F]|uniref:Polyprotein n=1 Tax=Alfalfa virus F TaxID=2170538 RepID=A0A2S0SV86_9VIRU|nr:polyprotein [Alfalfa virus F]AWB13379.1 polyprotein [Alfalfa virus F]
MSTNFQIIPLSFDDSSPSPSSPPNTPAPSPKIKYITPHLSVRFHLPVKRFPHSEPIFLSGGTLFQNAIDALSSTVHKDTITSPLLESITKPFRSSLQTFPFHIPPQHRPFLTDSGINISDFGSQAHPHPVHKTIELNLLHNVWNSYATAPSGVMFMKESKFEKMKASNPNFLSLCNFHLTSKDITRYPDRPPSLPNLPKVFMHDALMYFSPGQIVDLFLQAPNIQDLFCSLVVPPESSFTDLSLHPDLYKYSFEGSNLNYLLESNPAHSYSQPISAIEWLKITKISHPDITLSVTRLDSVGPVHSMLISKSNFPFDAETDTISFKVPSAILLPEPNSLSQDPRHRLVPTKIYHAIFAYVRAVRTLRVTDPAGFIRTQASKPEFSWVTSAAWDNLQHFALHTSPHRPISHYMLFRSPLQRFQHWARTNSYYFYLASCGIALPFVSALSLTLSHLSRCSVHHFSLFRHWFVPPPNPHFLFPNFLHSFLLPKAPFFSLQLHNPHPFPTLSKVLSFLLPTSFINQLKFLQPRSLPKHTLHCTLALASLPILAALYRWFSGPDTPQALHDQYETYFHPKEWTLSFPRKAITVTRIPFLPTDPIPISDAHPEPSESEIPLFNSTPNEHSPSSSPEPSPLPAVPPPSAIPPVQLPTVASNNPGLDPKRPSSSLLTAIIDPSTNAPATSSSLPPATTNPTPVQSEPFDPFSFSAPQTAPRIVPACPPGFENILSDKFGALNSSTAPAEPHSEPETSPLLADQSAQGPVVMFGELYPAEYHSNCDEFQTRARVNHSSNLPRPVINDCLLEAVSSATNISKDALWNALCTHLPDHFLDHNDIVRRGLNTKHLTTLCFVYKLSCTIHTEGRSHLFGLKNSTNHFNLDHNPEGIGHFSHSTRPSHIQLNGARAQDLSHTILGFRCSDSTLLPFKNIHSYSTHVSRAKNLISNMKNGFDGVMANVDPLHPSKARDSFLMLDQLLDVAASKSVSLVHLAGFAGCGKSYPVQQLLKTPAFQNFKVSVPSTELRSEWKEAIKTKNSDNWRISTWESSLLKTARVLVIDEIYKMPRGYLDLAIHADPTIEFVIILGDPLQGEYHSSNPSSSNHKLSPETSHLRKYIDFYCFWSRRIPQSVAAFFQVPTLNSTPGFSKFVPSVPTNTPLLVNSQSASQILQSAGFRALTIASSQGATFSAPTAIHLDKNTKSLSPQHSLVALTRSKSGILFTGDQSLLTPSSTGNNMFIYFSRSIPINIFHLFHKLISGLHIIRAPLTSRNTVLHGGAIPSSRLSSNPINSSFIGDAFSTASIFSGDGLELNPRVSPHFLPETRLPLHFDLPSAQISSAQPSDEVACSATPFTPVYPGEDFFSLAAHFNPNHDPELKEILYRDACSNQFPWVNLPFEISCQPSSLLAAIHSSKNDPTLLPASIQKRLRFRPNSSPYQISTKDEVLGLILFNSLCRAYHRNPSDVVPFDELLFIECINANEFSQLSSKTQAVIMANSDRSDPDWRWSAVKIFSKAQHKVNEGSLFGDWKACQTLALMHDAVILALGPVKKYQRLFDKQDQPSNIYIHASHTPFDLSLWCQQHLTFSPHIANDYTAFDQSQHGEAVVLERKKMERLSIPQFLINLHIHLKTNVSTQFGPLTCMRLTGEPGTYDDNTDYNLAVLFSEYNISSQAVLVSGDDSLIDSVPPTNPSWSHIAPLLSLRFKKEIDRYSLFCGYYVSPAGAVRSPKALFAKLMIAVDDQSISDKIASYITEFSVGHSLGQNMWLSLPLDQVPFQSANFDFFCRFAPRSLKVALNIGEVPSSIMELILPFLKHVTNPIWALLSSAQRISFLKLSKLYRQNRLPIHSQHEGELLPFSNSSSSSLDFAPLADSNNFYSNSDQVYHPHSRSLPSNPLFLSGGSMALSAIEALAQLLPLIQGGRDLLASTSDVSSPSSAQAEKSPAGSSPDARVLRAPPLPSPARQLSTPVSTSSLSIDLPFQWNFFDLTGTETKSASISIAGSSHITELLPQYRYARLINLELVVFPMAISMKYPQTVDVVWCTADQTITDGKIMATYGSQRISVGGPLNMSSHSILPANLSSLNPVVKDSVTYNDTPKLCVRFYENSDCKALGITAPICASLFIRGNIQLSSPTATPSK